MGCFLGPLFGGLFVSLETYCCQKTNVNKMVETIGASGGGEKKNKRPSKASTKTAKRAKLQPELPEEQALNLFVLRL